MVDVDDLAGFTRGEMKVEEHWVRNRLRQVENSSERGEHSSDGREEIAAVEGLAAGWGFPGDLIGFERPRAAVCPGDQAVVGTDDQLLMNSDDQSTAIGADLRINNGQMNRGRGK